MNAQTQIAPLRALREIVDEYEAKRAAIPEMVAVFRRGCTDLELASVIGGTYAGTIWGRGGSPSIYERDLEANLLRSAWRHVYEGLSIPRIAPASDRARYERELENPPPFTLDNIRANFGPYLIDPREHILRGLAEVFGDLDPAFKSHSKVKIGVKALPKRIILTGFGEYSYGSWGQEKLRDVLNAMASFDGREHVHSGHVNDLVKQARRNGGEAMWWGGNLRVFANGNGHLFFDRWALDIVNRGLAEYYGDVLPDTPDEEPEKRPGTAVSADLQFYRTPDAVADRLIARAAPRDGMKILEPSCGDGALLDALSRYVGEKRITVSVSAYEVHGGRAAEARANGYPAICRNFLDVPPSPDFDVVVMNPPFYGQHYQKHIEHARRFLKPGGVLYAILPITAVTDHGFVEPGRWGRDVWENLPAGSFASSGTRINTGIARFFEHGKD